MNNKYPVSINTDSYNSDKYFIVFSLNNKHYAINIQNVMEVINMPKIEFPSKLPEGVIGMFNYNGTMIKAVDLCPFLGFKTTAFSVNNPLIVLFVDDNFFAVHTDKIENIIQFDLKDIQPLPFKLDNSILKEVYKSEYDTVNIIDINNLNKLIKDNHSKESSIKYEELLPSDEKSKQIMELRTSENKMSQYMFSFPVNLNYSNQYMLFTLDNHNYYLDLKHIKEVVSLKRLSITKLPYTKDYIEGITNLKGDFIVVVNLKRFLNNDTNNIRNDSKLIITEGKNFKIAFLADEIKLVKNIKNTQKLKSYNINSNYILSEFTEENELYSILNFEKIINDERLYINIT